MPTTQAVSIQSAIKTDNPAPANKAKALSSSGRTSNTAPYQQPPSKSRLAAKAVSPPGGRRKAPQGGYLVT